MGNAFNEYLSSHDLDIYDVAKMLRDESPSSLYRMRSRNFYVEMLGEVQRAGWRTVNGKGGYTYIGIYDLDGGGVVSAYRVAEVLHCDISEITGGKI